MVRADEGEGRRPEGRAGREEGPESSAARARAKPEGWVGRGGGPSAAGLPTRLPSPREIQLGAAHAPLGDGAMFPGLV
jgi:hypothetical protein